MLVPTKKGVSLGLGCKNLTLNIHEPLFWTLNIEYPHNIGPNMLIGAKVASLGDYLFKICLKYVKKICLEVEKKSNLNVKDVAI